MVYYSASFRHRLLLALWPISFTLSGEASAKLLERTGAAVGQVDVYAAR
ncbi:hypothetical protein [Rosenbergiella collisarenosi]|nr:hypothetical protein [Rosenbergiella collisarenosi]